MGSPGRNPCETPGALGAASAPQTRRGTLILPMLWGYPGHRMPETFATRGFTLLELAVTLALAALLAGGAALGAQRFGAQGRVKYEASKVVDGLWELRSDATTGKPNPCMDFPDSSTVRLFHDADAVADGFDAGDALVKSWTYGGGVKARSIRGGVGPNHAVCFEGRGTLGSAGAALQIELGAPTGSIRTVRLLPSTGIAKVR
jgi:prepilin-type N-terminal cleavage/methylation domain-containing protein